VGGGGTKQHESFTVSPTTTVKITPNTHVWGSGVVGGVGSPDAGAEEVEPEEPAGELDDDLADAAQLAEPGPAPVAAGDVGEELADDAYGSAPGEGVDTAVPEMETGNVTGTPVLVGGADLTDSLAPGGFDGHRRRGGGGEAA